MKYHVHQKVGEQIDAISGHYEVLEEGRLPYKGREVLYVVEMALVDTSCCGPGGAYAIRVPGYIVSFKSKEDISGNPMTEVESIGLKEDKSEIIKILHEKFPSFTQIEFT